MKSDKLAKLKGFLLQLIWFQSILWNEMIIRKKDKSP